MAIISCGEFLTVFGEVNFDMLGFILCLSASICSGLRWTMVQMKLKTLDPPLQTSIATMRVLSPVMFFSMVFLTLTIEQPWNSLPIYFDTNGSLFQIVYLGFFGACLAICMIMCEFYLIVNSNAIILMMGGVIKEMLTIFVR